MIKVMKEVETTDCVLTIFLTFQTHFEFLLLLKASFQAVYILQELSRGKIRFFSKIQKFSAVTTKSQVTYSSHSNEIKVLRIPRQ